MTPGVREMCCRLNIGSTSFDRTAADLWRTAQVEISGETVRKTVIAEGVRVQQVQSTGELPTSFTAADCGVDKQRGSVVITRTSSEIPTPSFEQDSELGESNTPTEITLAADATSKGMSAHEDNSPLPTNTVTRMYLGVDGVMVPTVTDTEKAKRREGVLKRRAARALLDPQKAAAILPLAPRTTGTDCRYKEFKVIEFHSESQEHQHISLSAARRPEVGAIVKQMSDQLGFKTCDEKVANVDGATWIPEQLEQSEVEVDGLGLDFYHLSEQVHSARRAVFGEESSAGQEWATRQMHGFKHKGYDEVVPELMTWRSALRGQKRGAATKLVNYVTDRRAMIQYPEFLAEGWQIGSGATESRCRTSTRRLKVSGARWDMPNAAAVAALANLADSHQWPLYWPQLKPVNQTT